VLLAVDGPRVIDFGIARAADDSALTGTGQVIGSPGYMCPEQITGASPAGPPGDVFSLGAVLVFAATGSGPFGEGDSMSMLWRVVQDAPRVDGVPPRLLPVVSACLDKDPAARQTPAQLADHIGTLGPVSTSGWLPGPVLEQISRRAIMLLDLEAAAPPPEMFGVAPTEPWQTARSAPTMRRPAPADLRDASGPASAPYRPGPPLDRPATGPRPTSAYRAAPYPVDVPVSAPPPRSHRRAVIVGVVAVLLVAAGVGAGVLAYRGANRSGDAAAQLPATATSSARTTDPSASAPHTETATTTTAADAGSALPDGYVGTWSGTGTDVVVSFDVTVTLKGGKVGQQVGTSSNTVQLTRGRCDRIETLVSVSGEDVVLRAHLVGGNGCNDDGQLSTLHLRPDGGMDYSTPGQLTNIVAILHKQ
jgi:hypothetical protein